MHEDSKKFKELVSFSDKYPEEFERQFDDKFFSSKINEHNGSKFRNYLLLQRIKHYNFNIKRKRNFEKIFEYKTKQYANTIQMINWLFKNRFVNHHMDWLKINGITIEDTSGYQDISMLIKDFAKFSIAKGKNLNFR
jgi:hypothetical protein